MNGAAILLAGLLASASEASAPLLIAEGGRTDYAIYVADDATEPELHAAEELARFLGQISGAEIPVRRGADRPAAGTRTILVGPTSSRELLARDEIAELGKEGYRIRTRGPTLAIAGGRPRGTLYGVYSFLEDELDCRWLAPDVSRIPARQRIEIRPMDRIFVPALEMRSTDYPNSRDADWAVRNKINGTQTRIDARRGGKIAYGPFVHTFNSILNPSEHFDKHPEYFSEVNGKRIGGRTQLCLTNPDVLRIAIDTVRRWMREQPDATIFSVSQNDWISYCSCKDCSALMEEEGSPMGPYLRFVNAIADAVRDEFPEKAVDTLAYQFTRQPPTRTVPLPNVIVRLCSIECCFAHPLVVRPEVDRANAAFARDLEAWGKICDRLYIWDYVINYAHSVMPFPNLYSLKPNIRFFLENGVKGIYEEANYFSRGGELAELRTWIIAKTLWDPSYDTDRAIDEFLDGYYEEAAYPIRRYIDLLHGKARMDQIHFRIFDGPASPLFSSEVKERATALFDEAEGAVASKPEVLRRVRLARLPLDYVRLAHFLSGGGPEPDAEERWGRLQVISALFERFDAAAREEGISRISEGRRYDAWADGVSKALSERARAIPAPDGVAAQLYIWTQDYGRQGKRMEDHLDEVLAATRRAGYGDIQGWLHFFASEESARRTAELLRRHGLTMRAAYTGGPMHVEEAAEGAIETILERARRGARHGLRVVVLNPETIGREKTDDELGVQAASLDRLGGGLRDLGMYLAIHTHDPEMRSGAREWYHILRNTGPERVFFCLDLHWVYRGGQDPYRLLEEAGKRVVDLHLRNSADGVWSEDLGDPSGGGDIDHARVARILERIGSRPLLTVELAYEGKTSPTRTVEENLARSRKALSVIFGR